MYDGEVTSYIHEHNGPVRTVGFIERYFRTIVTKGVVFSRLEL